VAAETATVRAAALLVAETVAVRQIATAKGRLMPVLVTLAAIGAVRIVTGRVHLMRALVARVVTGAALTAIAKAHQMPMLVTVAAETVTVRDRLMRALAMLQVR
jgi:hypothetical protein